MSKRKLLYSSETILKTMKINTISLKSCQILFQELNFPSEFITIKLFLVFPKKWTTLLEKEKIYNLKQKKNSVACYKWNRKKTQNIEDFLKLTHFIWSLKSKSKKIKTFPANFHSWSKVSNPFPSFFKMKNFKMHHFFILNSKNIIYARLISTIR